MQRAADSAMTAHAQLVSASLRNATCPLLGVETGGRRGDRPEGRDRDQGRGKGRDRREGTQGEGT